MPIYYHESLEVKETLERHLLENIKSRLLDLTSLLEGSESHSAAEDKFYRFYHHSFKVYRLQSHTEKIVDALKELLPERELNPDFQRIISEGTGKSFDTAHNTHWHEETRPILEAYFHAGTMLKLAIQYGKEIEKPPQMLPSGWAALLYLYNLR